MGMMVTLFAARLATGCERHYNLPFQSFEEVSSHLET